MGGDEPYCTSVADEYAGIRNALTGANQPADAESDTMHTTYTEYTKCRSPDAVDFRHK